MAYCESTGKIFLKLFWILPLSIDSIVYCCERLQIFENLTTHFHLIKTHPPTKQF